VTVHPTVTRCRGAAWLRGGASLALALLCSCTERALPLPEATLDLGVADGPTHDFGAPDLSTRLDLSLHDLASPDLLGLSLLTVTVSGSGKVTSTPQGIDCPGSCSGYFSGAVTLTTAPAKRAVFQGWSGDCAGFATTCSLDVSSGHSVGAAFALANYMFVTSTQQPAGSLGGAVGADALCNQRAGAAGLPGTYVAWLSTAAQSAAAHVGNARGWLRPDERPFADSLSSLTAEHHILYPPRIDETGHDIGSGFASQDVATGTLPDGTGTGDCAGFSSTSGDVIIGFASWASGWFTHAAQVPCGQPSRLSCFGVDQATAIVLAPLSGRRVFTTSGTITGATGIAGADLLCNQEAAAAGLGGSYKALLATQAQSVAGRFVVSGTSVVRPDGVIAANSEVALFDSQLLAALGITAKKQVADTVFDVAWTGATSPRATAMPQGDCADWSSTSGSLLGWMGRLHASNPQFFYYSGSGCGHPGVPVYCLEGP
jgi:hypothetical protein